MKLPNYVQCKNFPHPSCYGNVSKKGLCQGCREAIKEKEVKNV